MSSKNPIYADYNASWPVTEKHLKDVFAEIAGNDANPSSIHSYGRKAKRCLEKARFNLAGFIGVSSQQVFFTSGATESNNIIVHSVCSSTSGKSAVVSPYEHPSLLRPLEAFSASHGHEIAMISGDKSGTVTSSHLEKALKADTALLCLSFVTSELGSVNSVFELAELARKKNPHIHIHVDSAQALWKKDLSFLKASQIDSMSFSGHKIGSVKGIGALYLKNREKLQQVPFWGGNQETGVRPGTENLLGAISFGLRAQDLRQTPHLFAQISKLTQALYDKLAQMPKVSLHGDFAHNVGNTINFYVKGHTVQELLMQFENAQIAVSAGSACSSGDPKPSSALLALGLSEEEATHSLRISLGEGSLAGDVERIADVIRKISN